MNTGLKVQVFVEKGLHSLEYIHGNGAAGSNANRLNFVIHAFLLYGARVQFLCSFNKLVTFGLSYGTWYEVI